VIDGVEAANDALVAEWPFGKVAGLPVWHLHEPLERLARLPTDWPRVALGSSGQFRTPGTPVWWGRMQQIIETVCTGDGKPMVKLHGLRMLNPRNVEHVPPASADSAYVSRKVGLANWGGCYKQASKESRAHVLVEYYENAQSAAV
jgi:hypothetical protein